MVTISHAITLQESFKSTIGLQKELSNFCKKNSFTEYKWVFYDDINQAIKLIKENLGSSSN